MAITRKLDKKKEAFIVGRFASLYVSGYELEEIATALDLPMEDAKLYASMCDAIKEGKTFEEFIG